MTIANVIDILSLKWGQNGILWNKMSTIALNFTYIYTIEGNNAHFTS